MATKKPAPKKKATPKPPGSYAPVPPGTEPPIPPQTPPQDSQELAHEKIGAEPVMDVERKRQELVDAATTALAFANLSASLLTIEGGPKLDSPLADAVRKKAKILRGRLGKFLGR